MANFSISFFTKKEEQYLRKSQMARDKLFVKICSFLTKHKISANYLTLLSFLQIVPFIIIFPYSKVISFFFLILSLFFDYLDGPLARYQKTDGPRGQFTDLSSDNFFFFFTILTFIYFKVVDGFWGSFYLFNYIFLALFALIINYKKAELFYVIKSKYFFYLFFLLYVVFQQNYFDPFLVFFSIYMLITNLFLFNKLRCLI